MNSLERTQRRLQGLSVDRPPNFDIFMTYAAHFINQPLSAYYQDYKVLCDANCAVLEAYDLDIVQAISDPYREAADLGLSVEFPHDAMPVAKEPLLKDHADFHKLRLLKPEQGRRMHDRLQAVQLFRDRVGGTTPVMGWVEGALAEAADLRGVSQLLMDFFENPEWVAELLQFCVEIEIEFARAQVLAGADIIGLGDAVASQISPDMYEQYALPYEKRIFKAVHEFGALARLHICGDTTLILQQMAESGADIVDLDWMVDFAQAAELYENSPALCGNFDPVDVMLNGTPERVKKAVIHCATVGGSKSFSGAGCEIPDKTPHENILAQTQALKEFAIDN